MEETVILDIGSRYSKVGFVGEPAPRRIIPTRFELGTKRLSQPFNYQKNFKSGRCVRLFFFFTSLFLVVPNYIRRSVLTNFFFQMKLL